MQATLLHPKQAQRDVEVQLYAYLTPALESVGCQCHGLAAVPPRKTPGG